MWLNKDRLTQLSGKSISMRVHRSGELLDSFGWSHLSGAGRGGDLVTEVLLQPVLRLPHQVPKPGRPVGSTFRLRYSVDGMLERDQTWVLSYERADGAAPCRGCLVLVYEGSITEASTDKHPARPMVLSGTGTIEGSIVLGPGRGRRALVRHDWSVAWTRKLRTERENGTLRGELLQTALIEGWVEQEAAR